MAQSGKNKQCQPSALYQGPYPEYQILLLHLDDARVCSQEANLETSTQGVGNITSIDLEF
jgi:hypothetical protein